MQPEYLKYWGLEKAPFSLTPDPDMLYLSKQHQEGLIRLKYAVISNKGGALLVSENAGDGKTSLLARLSRDLQEQYLGGCRVVFIDHPTLTANQIVIEISRQLGVSTSTSDKLTILNELRQFLLDCHRQEIKCVFMLDEGQMLCNRPDLLQELRVLLNFCVSDAFLLTFVLSGQRPLDETLRAMPEFYQRLPVRFFLKNLDRDDTREMIRHRLHLAGNPKDREIFSEDGYTGIYNYSKGCPRIICSVADLALVIAHSRYSKQVDFVEVSQACSDMNRTDGAYHYFYFLKSFHEQADAGAGPESSATVTPQSANKCLNCGSEISSEVKFCPECGKSLVVETEESALEVTPSSETDSVAEETVEEKVQEEPAGQAVEKKPDGVRIKTEADKETKITRRDLPKPEIGRKKPEVDSSQRLLHLEVEKSDAFSIGHDERETELTETGEDEPEKQADESGLLPESEIPGGKIKCSFCGLIIDREIEKCPNCDEPLKKTEPDGKEPVVDRTAGKHPGESLGDEPEVATESFTGQDEVGDRESTEHETEVEERAEMPGTRVCPHCGESSRRGSLLCDTCGSPLESDSYEQVLLKSLDELSFRKYILSKSYLRQQQSLDPKNEELLFIPLNRFWGGSPVLRYAESNSGDSFTTCCGLIFTSGKLRFVFTGGVKELSYEDIETVRVEKLTKNGIVIVYQLILSTVASQYRISLPYRLSVARQMSELLGQYLSAKVEAMAHVAVSR